MAIPCNATQIADFVLLWGMSGTFPQHCNYAEDAENLKSLDLITSTVGVFVEAFWLKFEGIYRKHKMDILLSEEKFIEFLKPRCLLLTKDDKCFNFILVCTFVSEVIHSFFEENECYHLVKVASKCLAVILKNRFKRIFEAESGWVELMSFCIKIHNSIYPQAKKCKSDGNQSVGEVAEREDNGKENGCRFPVTMTIDASFPKLAQGLTELSVEKYAADYNDSDTEVSGKKCSTPLKKDFTIEKKGEKLKGLCDLEFLIPTGTPHTLQLKDDDSSSKEESVDKEKTCDEKNASENNEICCAIYPKDSSSPNFSHEVSQNVIYQSDEDTENFGQMKSLKKQLTFSFGKDLAVKKVPEKLDLCNFEPTSLAGASVALQMKGEVSSPSEESEDKEKVVDESSERDDNKKDYATDSLLPDLAHGLSKMYTEKKAINKNVPEKLDLCNFDPTSLADASVALQMRGKVSSLSEESEDTEKVVDESDNNKDYATNSLLRDLAHEFTKMSSEKKAINTHVESAEKPGEVMGFRQKLALYSGKDSIVENVRKKLDDLCKLMFASSADAPHALQLKDKESSEDDSEDNEEPFSILCMTTDQICSRITDNPQHLSEIMNLIKKCEEEIEPNIFSPLLTDNLDEDFKDLDNSSGSDLTIFELGIKTVVFATNFQDMKMDPSVKRIFRKDNPSDDQSISKSSGDESSDEMSNGVILTSENLLCSRCAGGMNKFFDACVIHFGTIWYWTHHLVTDLFSFECHDNSE